MIDLNRFRSVCLSLGLPLPCGLVLIALFVGCGDPTSGTVTGNVTYKGEPVFLGTVAFHSDDGRTVSAAISAGKYHADKVPLGPSKVTVQAHPPSPQMTPPPFADNVLTGDSAPAALATSPPKFIALPERYANKTKSGLSFEARPGEQSHDVQLVP